MATGRSIAVVGGGALGLTAALRLLQAGERVTLIEREGELGGLAAGFRVGDAYLEKFYHHLFRSDRDAIALIEELGLGDRLVWRTPHTSALIGGRVYHLESPLSLFTFNPLPLVDRLRFYAVLAYLKLDGRWRRFEGKRAAGWLLRHMGRRAYDVHCRPMLQGKFGGRYPDIAMTWFWSRVNCRSLALGYLRGGFQLMYEELGRRIRELGGEIHLGTTVRRIVPPVVAGGEFRVETDAWERNFDLVVSTLPPRLLFRLVDGLPEDYRRRYEWGEAYGAHCVVLELNRSLTDAYWLNINDPGFPFLVLVEHTNMLPREDYGGRVLVYLGNYLPMDDPLFRESDEAVLDRFLPALARIHPTFTRDWVERAHVFKAPFAQPIVTTDYREHIPPFDTPIPGLYVGSMFQVYPQDRGQNYSIRLGQRLAEHVVAHAPARRSAGAGTAAG